jgi:hypothetical protein
LLTFSARSSRMTDMRPLRSSSHTFVWPSLNCLNHCLTLSPHSLHLAHDHHKIADEFRL